MTDRRQHRRFVLDPPLTGELQFSSRVRLERIEELIATVLTRTPGLTREPVSLRLLTVAGQVHCMLVRAFESTPVTLDGALWQRVHCERLEDQGGSAWPDVTPPRLEDVLACDIVRRVPARVRQVSANGCLFETPLSLHHVSFARLDVQVHTGEQCAAMLRVCRPGSRVPGSGHCRVAAEFVPPHDGTRRSIQQLLAQYQDACAG